MEKIVSILLILIVAVCSVPIVCVSASSVSQDGMYEFDIIDGSYARIWRYNGSQSSITIPSTVKLNDYISYPVKSISGFSYTSIRNVTISYGIETISSDAFYCCDDLRYISIPKSIKSIGNRAFLDCNITKVDYIGSVEDWCNILFDRYGSSPVTHAGTTEVYFNGTLINSDLIIPNTVSAIKDSSFHNFNFTSVTIPGSVKSIGRSAFGNCVSLKKCFINEGLKNIGSYAFSSCDNLELVTLPKSFDNNNVDENNLFSEDNKLIVHGHSDSYAQQYAIECGIPFLEHSFTVDTGEYIEPNCTKPGGKVLKCSYCEEKLLNTPALGHNFGNWYNTVNPNCTSTGISERACSRCNQKERKVLPKLGHKYGNWITLVGPTCYNEGQKYRACNICGNVEYGTIAKVAHQLGKWEVENEPTYFKKGTKIRVCSVCGLAVENKAIPKLILKTPTIKKIKGKRGNKKITFSKIKDASYYEIWTEYKHYGWTKYKTVKSISCSLKDWKNYVKVRAVVKKGNKKVYSKFSKVKMY